MRKDHPVDLCPCFCFLSLHSLRPCFSSLLCASYPSRSLPVSCCRYAQLRFRPGFESGCFRPIAGALRFRNQSSTLCQFTPTIPIEPDLHLLITYPFFVCLLFIYSIRHEMLTDVSPLFVLPCLGSTFVPFPSTQLPFLPIRRDTIRRFAIRTRLCLVSPTNSN